MVGVTEQPEQRTHMSTLRANLTQLLEGYMTRGLLQGIAVLAAAALLVAAFRCIV